MTDGEMVVLREKRLEDAKLDYAWRVDEELSALDATTPTRMSYNEYLRMYQEELRHQVPWSKRFAIETQDGKMIGNCMYYDVDTVRGQTELGIMIGDKDYWSQGYGTNAVAALVTHIFTTTSLTRVYLHTLTWNIRAQKSFLKCGFVALRQVKRSGYEFLMMELLKEQWEASQNSATL